MSWRNRTRRSVRRVGARDDLDAASFRNLYRTIYAASPGLASLGMIVSSLGEFLEAIGDALAYAEQQGSGNYPALRRDFQRRIEDWQQARDDLRRLLVARVDPTQQAEYPAMLKQLRREILEGYRQDQVWDYENGQAVPPRYGLAFAVGTLLNQVRASLSPVDWIGTNPDDPWYSWVPEYLAAGWVTAINNFQELVSGQPDQGPGWGVGFAKAAAETGEAVQKAAENAVESIKSAARFGAGAAGVLLLGILLLRGRK